MLKRDRVLAKLDELNGYLQELRQIAPADFNSFVGNIEKKRACERLLQISVEAALDVCGLLVSGLQLGLPADENDILERLDRADLLAPSMTATLRRMRGFRNILVHEYGRIDDRIVFAMIANGPQDFRLFTEAVLRILRDQHEAR